MITWRPIAELPDELKDGRINSWEDLLLAKGRYVWIGRQRHDGTWLEVGRGRKPDKPRVPTHFAEINAPEGRSDG